VIIKDGSDRLKSVQQALGFACKGFAKGFGFAFRVFCFHPDRYRIGHAAVSLSVEDAGVDAANNSVKRFSAGVFIHFFAPFIYI